MVQICLNFLPLGLERCDLLGEELKVLLRSQFEGAAEHVDVPRAARVK